MRSFTIIPFVTLTFVLFSCSPIHKPAETENHEELVVKISEKDPHDKPENALQSQEKKEPFPPVKMSEAMQLSTAVVPTNLAKS